MKLQLSVVSSCKNNFTFVHIETLYLCIQQALNLGVASSLKQKHVRNLEVQHFIIFWEMLSCMCELINDWHQSRFQMPNGATENGGVHYQMSVTQSKTLSEPNGLAAQKQYFQIQKGMHISCSPAEYQSLPHGINNRGIDLLYFLI